MIRDDNFSTTNIAHGATIGFLVGTTSGVILGHVKDYYEHVE